MTDDLVKRLREYRVGCGLHCEAHDAQEPLGECIEAADRIEKDAQHIDEMYALVAAMNADHTASKTRIEKLEAALRDLSDGWECCPVSQAMRRVAREALKED